MRKLFLILFIFSSVDSIGQPMRKLLRKQAAAPVGPYLSDLFTGTNGTSLTAHTMNIGPGWTLADGFSCSGVIADWKIQSNAAITDLGIYTIAQSNAGVYNVVASVDIIVPNANNYFGGLVFRYTDCANYWVAGIQRDASGTPYMFIYKNQAGTLTSQATVNLPGATNSTVTVTVTLSGNSIVALASTTETCNTSNSFNATATRYGLFGYLDGLYNAQSFDNFLVTD